MHVTFLIFSVATETDFTKHNKGFENFVSIFFLRYFVHVL